MKNDRHTPRAKEYIPGIIFAILLFMLVPLPAMASQTNNMNDTTVEPVYIVLLTYKKPLAEIDKYGKDHVAFLDKYFAAEKFIVSGRQNPRTGGVIIAHKVTRKELEEILKEDPFHQHGLADYDITELIPVKYQDAFKTFITE